MTFANGKLTVPAGVTEFTITTPVKTDNLSEGNETVKYTVGGVDGNEAIITDTTPAVAVKSVTNANNATEVNEGASLTTTVTLNRATDKQIELDYKQNLMGSTAEDFTSGKPTFTAGVSLSADGTKLIVPKGVSTFDITTTVKADNVTEATAESFNYTVGGKTSSTVTINDTSKGAATIDNSANDGVKTKPASEGGNLVTTVKLVAGKETELAITRTAGTATDDDFDTPVYTVTKKADGSTATVGATLTFANGKLTVPAGVTEFTITTPVKTDNLSEGNETVKYTVGGVDGNEAIITDTTPAVAVKSVTNANNATEVNEGASLTTTVTLNRATDKQIELDYKQNLMGSTAEDFTSGKPTFTAGVSLSADGTKLIVPKGVSTFDITTTVKADNVTEATAESFNYTVGGKTSSTVTINDTSKGAATIDNSANDGVKTKPASEGGNLVTTVKLVAGKETELAITRTAGTATDDDFDTPVYTVTKKADGSTATVGATLTFANGKLTVPAGVTEFTITTPVKTDNLSEGNETVKYTVGGVDGNEAIITDTTPAVAVKSVTNANNATEVNEGASLTTTVTLNRATDKQIELDYKQNLMGSTAEDFTSGKPTFTAGVSLSADGTKLIVPKGVSTFDITTTVKADNVTEATAESFNYTVGGKTSSTVTINDTSKGAATIDNSANDGVKTKPASEGGNLVTTVKLVAGKETELAITRTAGTATDDDFDTPVYTVTKKADGSTATVGATLTFANGKLTVPAGVTEFTITTPVKTDNLSEGNETVKYTVGGVDGNEAIITDTTPAVAVKSVTNANNATEVNEGASLTTTVTLNRATDKQIELDYKQNLMGSTAEDFTSGKPTFTAGVSLSADGTKLIVPKGVSTFDITTTVKADNVTEATAESFNYTVGGKTSSTVTINDTSKGAATIDNSANDGVKTKPASEGGNLVTTVKLVAGKETELAITRTAGTATDDDFDTPVYTVTKKADGSTATVGATLTFANGKLTVPAGVTEFTITTPVKTDNLSEGNETVKYTVGGVDGNEAIITDTTPAVAVKSVTNANNATEVNEGASLTTTVTLNRATDKQIELDYKQNLMGSTAEDFTSGKPTFTAGVSLSADGTKLIVPKGVSTFDITTTVKADNVTEATAESFNYTVGGKTSSTVTINDTSKGAATIDNSANDGVKTKPASEGGNLVTTVKLVAGKETELAITRTAGTATDDDFDTPVYTVTKKADGSTATVGATLTFANGKLTVPAGVTEFTITTPVKTDNLSEGNETVKYTVGGVDGNEAIITDTTPAVAVKSVTNANNATEVNEGASLTTTVTLNRATDKQIELDYKQNLMGSTAEDFTSGKPTFTAGVSLSADGTKLIVPKGVSTFDITTTVKADNVTEATAESFNYTVGGKTSSTVTINDTSKGAATIDNSANDGVKTKPASEGGNLVTTVKLVAGKETELAITRTAGTATDDDFDTPVYTVTKKADGSTATVGATLTFANGKLTVPAGVTEFTITTPVKTDNLSEGNETVKYTVGGVDGNEAIITDTTPAVAVKSVTNANNATEVNEGASLTTTVTLNRATDKQIELDYKQNLMGSTAEDFTSGKPTFTAGVSLSADGTKLIVPKGVSTFDITTTVKADNVTEATAESFNYTVGGKTSSTVTINDTSKGAATIDNSANDGVKTKPASEGGNLVTTVKLVAGKETELAITRTAGTATDDDFDTPVYTVTKKADGSTATVGATLTFANGKLTVPAGVTEFTITTPVKTDNLSEGNETVKYTVGGVDGNEAIITDTTPAVAVKSVTNANNATEVNEGASLTTTVTLNRATDKQIELDYKQNLMGSTAEDFTSGKPTFTAGVSLSADGTKLIVPKGVSTFDITTTVKADNVTEATAESFNYTVGGKTSSTVTINDTSKGAATIDNSANDGVKTKPASEGGNLVTTVKLVAGKETELAITRTAGTATDDDFDTPVYTVTKKADGSTATVGATLTFANGKLTVPAGVTEFTITTPVKTDNLSEGNETVKYTVGGVDGNEAIITDTTPAVAVKSVTNANNATEVNEGASLTTTVTLNRATDKQIELDYKQNLMGSTAEDFTSGKPTFTAGVSLSADGTKLIVPKGVSTFDITTTVKADNVTEATAESFNYTVGGKTSSTVTINDTSKGAATIDNSANDGVKTKPASEGGNLVTTVKLVAGKETELAITRTAGTATDDDFDTPVYTVTKKADGSTATVGATLTFANGKLTVPAGVTEFTITTPVKTDNLSEGNETVKYTVGGVDGNEAIITDTTPAVAVKSVTNANNATEVNEGASLTTTVTLNRATDKQIELDYKQNLMGSTAEDFTSGKPTFTAGVSLSADGTKLIVPKGVSTFDITTTVKADNVTEATAESFNYTVGGKTSSTVTINDTSKKPAPTQISSLTINDDDGTGNDVGIDGQYVGRIADGAVTNDTTPTLTITLNQALQDNETLELVRYIKDPITKNLIVDGTFTRKTPAKSSSDDKIYTLEDDLQSVTTAGTDYVYKARVFDSNTKEEFAEKTESMRLDTVAEQAVVTSYDPKTHILKGLARKLAALSLLVKMVMASTVVLLRLLWPKMVSGQCNLKVTTSLKTKIVSIIFTGAGEIKMIYL
ncbi:Uncharacterised protein [Moraxella caprae]|uniref:Uncharacterized protein n=1 Tax=Moraxella caprae TaxID=90240 RepID=A0A378U7G0_9GAMM|nr:Calx-beta domain-containing protein [Moraxella caprae]STZ70282.1 Uncharacterised protein [Moraxella caprae]